MTSPRFWLVLCWLAAANFGWGAVNVLTYGNTWAWADCILDGASLVLATARRRTTIETAVLDVLRRHPEGVYALDLWHLARIGPGSLYPLLTRLEDEGQVRSWFGETHSGSGPRRRRYALAGRDGGS
ncbi:MAG TPA: helix-turn-helix transcriptional regulator [Nocardioides sp.]|nr:helix-turn-helix transcriptional regulator [Nocardioides sp.]